MQSTVLFSVTLILFSSFAASRPSTGVYPRAGLFPIIECPDDSPYPQVIYLPSVGGVDLAANQYVVCFKGVPQVFNCSEGLFFNWSTMSCDFPYERSASTRNGTSPDGDLDLIPVGPIQVPISPELPVPIWQRSKGQSGSISYPYPITKPNPEIVLPVPVLPAHPLPPIHVPIPYNH